MTNSCGIDLGTTNSCIALATEDGPQVVRDQHGRATVPSVAYEDAKGNLIIGHVARSYLGLLPSPVMTAKRKMGTDEVITLGTRSCDAMAISTMILKYLKERGEEANQGPLEKAVVTVPAYFSHRQKQETESAAELAGFSQVVVLQEPVAAALKYCFDAGEEPMIVLCYDLGGGTFDATVLERTADNEIKVLAFGGDKWLGGDNFDTTIAEHLRRQLKARNYAVDWDLERQEHYAKFQRLKALAENAKIQLSSTEHTVINYPGAFVDENGTLVDLDEQLSRDTLYELIDGDLARSVELTRETLERSGVAAANISKVIMVGGSSHIPRVRERLLEAFGKPPELVDPETVVALGAAIKAAAAFGRHIEGRDVAVDLDYPAQTNRPTVRVNGRLSREVRGWTVRLARGESEWSRTLEGRSTFRFDDVPVSENEDNEFAFSIDDEARDEVLAAELVVVHRAEAATFRAPEALVAQPISIHTIGGLTRLIDPGARLPIKVEKVFHTQDQSGVIRIPIYEGSVAIGEVRLTDVPRSLRVGSEVKVELAFDQDYRVNATAVIPDTGQQTQAVFEIPAVKVLSRDEVRKRLERAQERWERARAGGAADAPQLATLRTVIEGELGAPEPKMGKIAEDLSQLELGVVVGEAETLVVQALQPPLPEVENRIVEAQRQAEKDGVRKGFQIERFRVLATELRQQAQKCWRDRDLAGWRDVVSQLTALERLVNSSLDLDRMPDDEVQDLAVHLVLKIESEMNRDARARRELAEVDMDELRYLAVREPREGAIRGLNLLRRLVNAGITTLPSDDGSRPVSPTVGDDQVMPGLAGLLRGGRI